MLQKNFDRRVINSEVKLYEKPKLLTTSKENHIEHFSYGGNLENLHYSSVESAEAAYGLP